MLAGTVLASVGAIASRFKIYDNSVDVARATKYFEGLLGLVALARSFDQIHSAKVPDADQ